MAGVLSSIVRAVAPTITKVAGPVVKAISKPITSAVAVGAAFLGKSSPSPSPTKAPNIAATVAAAGAAIGTRFTPSGLTKALTIGAATGAAYQVGKEAVAAFAGGESIMANLPRYTGGIDIGVAGPGIFSSKDLTPNYYGGVTRSWMANQALFQKNENGTITVQKKDGSLKTYRPHKPIVFGKRLDPVKLARVIKKHRGVWKELNKVFGKRGKTTCPG